MEGRSRVQQIVHIMSDRMNITSCIGIDRCLVYFQSVFIFISLLVYAPPTTVQSSLLIQLYTKMNVVSEIEIAKSKLSCFARHADVYRIEPRSSLYRKLFFISKHRLVHDHVGRRELLRILHFPQVQLPCAHVQSPPQSQLEFPQPGIFKSFVKRCVTRCFCGFISGKRIRNLSYVGDAK